MGTDIPTAVVCSWWSPKGLCFLERPEHFPLYTRCQTQSFSLTNFTLFFFGMYSNLVEDSGYSHPVQSQSRIGSLFTLPSTGA
jgi:hypothetical protein